jgi:hypothetical protein
MIHSFLHSFPNNVYCAFSNVVTLYENVYTRINILSEITLLKIRGIQKLFGEKKRDTKDL